LQTFTPTVGADARRTIDQVKLNACEVYFASERPIAGRLSSAVEQVCNAFSAR
jgi:hypothetical protein